MKLTPHERTIVVNALRTTATAERAAANRVRANRFTVEAHMRRCVELEDLAWRIEWDRP